jgi:hypothetical protein
MRDPTYVSRTPPGPPVGPLSYPEPKISSYDTALHPALHPVSAFGALTVNDQG